MKRLGLGLALLCLAFGAVTASAQDKYPSKPVKIVVPYAPGGATDIVARILGEQLRQILGQSFVVENKPGAFGIVAIEEMARAQAGRLHADGRQRLDQCHHAGAHARKVPINFDKNVVSVSRLVDIPVVPAVTTTNFDVKTVPELIDYAKKNPGKLRYASVGVGSFPHFDMEFFAKRAGDLDMIAIPNKTGAAGMINDLVTGDAQIAFLNVASTAAMIKAGKLRPLALVAEQRLPELSRRSDDGRGRLSRRRHDAWQGMLAPASTPKEVLETLLQGVGRGAAGAAGAGGVREAELQRRAEQVARRGQGLARRRDRDLEGHHRRGEDRSRGIASTRNEPPPTNREDIPCAGSDQCWCFACWRRRSGRKRRTSIRANRSRSWCRSGRAAPPTSSCASSASRCGRSSASRW